jgi:hypothetical protein
VAKLALAGLAVLLATCPATAQQHITQADLLRRVIDLQRLPTPPPAGAHTVRYSSRAGAAPRRTADDWDILLDGAGPGAITRLWLGQAVGDIRILVDGQPVIDTTADALLAGRLPPIVEPLVFRGTTSYFPIGFDQRCQVLRRGSTSAYEINAVQFPRGTEVEPFQLKLDDAAQAALVEVRKILKAGWTNKQLFGGQRLLPVAVEQELGPDEVLTDALENGGTVRALYVALTDRTNPPELYALHRCVLRIFVDGAKTPNVESPLCDFFGAGFDLSPVHSLIFGTDATLPIPLPERRSGEDRFMYCLLPMPFRDGLKVEIQNLNEDKRKIGLLLHMRVDTRPPAADALRFYARFRKEDPCRTTEYPLLETTSRGRLVGYLLNVDCPRPGWWGAGTDKLWVDRAKAPAYVGIDAAACFDQVVPLQVDAGPLAGVTRTGPYGKSSAYRWCISDCVDFQKFLRFTIGNQQDRGLKDTYFSSVAYWYAEPKARQSFKALKSADLNVPGLLIPGAIEIEDNIRGKEWGSVIKQKYADGAELSGKAAANITTDQPVEISVPSATEQTVLLKLRVNPRRSFDTITLAAATGSPVGTVTYDRRVDGIYPVGPIHLQKGDNWLTVTCPRPAMLDCWILEPLPRE